MYKILKIQCYELYFEPAEEKYTHSWYGMFWITNVERRSHLLHEASVGAPLKPVRQSYIE